MVIVRTSYTNKNGTPKVIARGAGKQRTVAWDLSKSTDWNHGNAAGTLLDVLLSPLDRAKVVHPSGMQRLGHDQNDSGTLHGFSINV